MHTTHSGQYLYGCWALKSSLSDLAQNFSWRKHTCPYMSIHVHAHTCTCVHTCVHTCAYAHVYIHVRMHTCAYMRVCLTVVAEGLLEGGDWVGDGSALLCQINNRHIVHTRTAQPSKPHPCMFSNSSTAAFIILFVFMITGAPPISSPDVRHLCRGQSCNLHILLVEVLPDGRSSCNQRHK